MYFVTISELAGTDGQKIAKKVAGALGYTYYGEDELSKAAAQMGFLADVKAVKEKTPSFFDRYLSEKPKVHLERMQAVIYELAKKGNAVFVGRGSQLLLHSFDCALHVLVTGSAEKRVQRVVDENHVPKDVAERMISRSDGNKNGFFRFAYDADWLDAKHYDLVVNTDKLSVDMVVKLIADAARSDEIKACGIDSVRNLEQLALTRKIESEMLDAGLSTPHLFFSVEGSGAVRVTGLVSSQEEKEEVLTHLKKVPGVKSIENDLTVYVASGI